MLAYVDILSSCELTTDKLVMLGCLVKFLTRHKHHHSLITRLKVLLELLLFLLMLAIK